MEGGEAGMRTMPTVPSLGTEGEGEIGGGTGPRAHLLAGYHQEVSPRGPVIGGTGLGQGTGTGDPAPPPMIGSPVPTTGSRAPMTGRHHQSELPRRMTGHRPRPVELPLLMTGPQATLRAELLLPMTGPAPLTTGGRRRPPG